MDASDWHDFFRRTAFSTFGGLALKTLVFVPFFVWARHSDLGAAALRGLVGADVLAWLLFGLLEWPFRRFQVTAGGVFELVLIVLYLNRGPLFEITSNMESTALSALFFFGFLTLKAGIWSAEHILEVTGVREPGSP